MPGAQKVIKQYGALSFGQNECAGLSGGHESPFIAIAVRNPFRSL